MRIDSTLGVGSPIARVAAFAAATLLMALLSAGALVAGAQSPSPAPPDEVALSFFTGRMGESAEGGCLISEPTSEAVGGVTQQRGESWGCLSWTTDDPRISGETKFIWNTDAVTMPSGTGEISAVRQRIENEAGAWEGTITELQVGSELLEAAGWFIGEGAYDGLAAYVVSRGSGDIWGVIRPDDDFGAPEAFAEE